MQYLEIPEFQRAEDDEVDFLENSCDEFDGTLLAQSKLSTETELQAPISSRERITEQSKDEKCQDICLRLEWDEGTPFGHDEYGVLRCVTKNESRIVITQSLTQLILSLAHHMPIGGHPGGRKMYNTLRKLYYWPGLAFDYYSKPRNCVECAKERVRLRK